MLFTWFFDSIIDSLIIFCVVKSSTLNVLCAKNLKSSPRSDTMWPALVSSPQTGLDDLGRSRFWLTALGCVLFRDWKGYGTDGSLSVPLKDQIPFNSGSAKAADSTAPLNVSRPERAEGGNSTTGLNHLNFSHVCPHADTPSAVDAPQSIFIGRWSSMTLGGPGSATSQVFKRQFVGKMGRNVHVDKALNCDAH